MSLCGYVTAIEKPIWRTGTLTFRSTENQSHFISFSIEKLRWTMSDSLAEMGRKKEKRAGRKEEGRSLFLSFYSMTKKQGEKKKGRE